LRNESTANGAVRSKHGTVSRSVTSGKRKSSFATRARRISCG